MLRAPFPWFGGKSRAASLIWERFGKIDNYVEPFAGSLAVLLGSPEIARTETVNDKDGFVANFWRALAADPEAVAAAADWPINENDLHARHVWLVGERPKLTARLEGDPEFYDVRIAGWWVWGLACWIGSGWCSGNGPWVSEGGELVRRGPRQGVTRKLVDLGAGRGVNRRRVHLSNVQGVTRSLVNLGNGGQGVHRQRVGLTEWFRGLANRLRRVRVCCGDWERVLGPAHTTCLGLTGVVLDPPYALTERTADVYAVDDGSVSSAVRDWAVAHGDDPRMRIVLCGYDTEHQMPESWQVVPWKAAGGYGRGRGKINANRERLWFSPHCLGGSTYGPLFGGES